MTYLNWELFAVAVVEAGGIIDLAAKNQMQ